MTDEIVWHRCATCAGVYVERHMATDDPTVCNACWRKDHPIRLGTTVILIDAGGEDSPIPGRRADRTHMYNAGLPGIETVIGTRADGKPRLAYRPVTNAELANNRGVHEYAKRHGLEPLGKRYRSPGGR